MACGPSEAGSSGYQRLPPDCGEQTGLQLVPCPKCGSDVLELVCGAGSKVPRAVFFKCIHHDRNVPGTCPWFLFEGKYRRYLIARGLTGGGRNGVQEQEAVVRHDEEGGLLGEEQDLDTLKVGIAGLDAKLNKLVKICQIGLMCCAVLAVCILIRMLLK